MPEPIQGIHHITAIASDPQRNLDFYAGVLGLRLVKLTVNFDDPGTYHFYFGDDTGHPGSVLTFFPWQDIRRGRRGLGQVSEVAFAVPADSLGYWTERLKKHGVSASRPFTRFDEGVLSLADPDGLLLDLVARPGAPDATPWTGAGVPMEHAIRGFAAPTLLLEESSQTVALLTDIFGMQPVQQAGTRSRFSGQAALGGQVDIDLRPAELPGGMGAGVVHHIAFRAPSDEQQLAWREILVNKSFNVTPVLDRTYFHSIYFREPGGILFEIATDPPGFTLDEPRTELGTHLRLPEWIESKRADLERALPKLKLPGEEVQAGQD